eukprot:5669713-Prymnesium_polylepis.1
MSSICATADAEAAAPVRRPALALGHAFALDTAAAAAVLPHSLRRPPGVPAASSPIASDSFASKT